MSSDVNIKHGTSEAHWSHLNQFLHRYYGRPKSTYIPPLSGTAKIGKYGIAMQGELPGFGKGVLTYRPFSEDNGSFDMTWGEGDSETRYQTYNVSMYLSN